MSDTNSPKLTEPSLHLESRTSLPDFCTELVHLHPRELWFQHPAFSELAQFWLQRHANFRQVFKELTSLSEAFLDQPFDDYMHKTRRYTQFVLDQLQGHHMIEDQHYFPVLARLDERVKKGFQLLDSDHDSLHAFIEDSAKNTSDMLQALSDSADLKKEVARLAQFQARFEKALNRHLDDEEDIVIPVMLEHGFTG